MCLQTTTPRCAADAQKKNDKHGFVNMRKAGPLKIPKGLPNIGPPRVMTPV